MTKATTYRYTAIKHDTVITRTIKVWGKNHEEQALRIAKSWTINGRFSSAKVERGRQLFWV